MSGGVLEATTSTALVRTTVHAQYNGRALGVVLLNNLIPISLNVRQPGGSYKKARLIFGTKAHDTSPYKDYGLLKKCCRTVLLFNVQHYFKCYLTDNQEDGPYTYNCCRKCGATLADDCGHLVQVHNHRSYNVDKYIHKATGVLQSEGTEDIFSFRKENC